MAGVVVSLALGGLKDTTGSDGKWSLIGGATSRIAPRAVQPMAKWTGSQLHLDLTAPALVEMDAYDARGSRLGRVAQLLVDAGSRDIPVTVSPSRGARWLLLTVDGRRQVLSTGGQVQIQQQALPGALRSAVVDTVEQIIYTLQGQLISADTVRNLIQSGLEKWVQEFSVSGLVLTDPRVTVDSVFAWFDGGRMTGMRRARLGYSKANLAYSGRLYTVKSFTDVYDFRVWLNVMANGNRKTGISDTTDFSSDFGDINFIPKFNIANAIPSGAIIGPVTGLVNTDFEYTPSLTRADEVIAHYEWDLGDGGGFKSGGIKKVAKWLQPGSYPLQVKLTDIDSNVTILSKTVNITNQAAIIAGIRDTIITPDDIVIFSANAVDTDGVSKVLWDFGDGVVDSTFGGPTHSVSHKFPGVDSVKPSETRIYNLTVTVVDNLGNQTVQTAKISVNNDVPVVSVRDTVGEPDSLIKLHATMSDRGRIVRTEWSLDGLTFIAGGIDTTVKLPHVLTLNYPLYVRVIDEDGNISKTDTIRVITGVIITDPRDGQRYRIVTIGSQIWLAQNLNFNANGSWWFNYSEEAGAKYGRLYNWASVMALNDSCNMKACSDQVQPQHQGNCPEGWHVPSDIDWHRLVLFADSSSAISSLGSATGWSNYAGIDKFGFSMLPGGLLDFKGMDFWGLGVEAYFWSSTMTNSENVIARKMLRSEEFGKRWGMSARCIADTFSVRLQHRDTVYEVGSSPNIRVVVKGLIGNSGGRYEWSVNGGEFRDAGADTVISLPLTFTLGYPIKVRVTNKMSGAILVDSVQIRAFEYLTDTRDGQRYPIIPIGTQNWMGKNMNFQVDSSWWYKNSADSGAKYGRLYHWAAAMMLPDTCNKKICTSLVQVKHKGICPTGWHIPTDFDFDTLVVAAGGTASAGRRLKSKNGWWESSSALGIDSVGFQALPAGISDYQKIFDGAGSYTTYWSSTTDLVDFIGNPYSWSMGNGPHFGHGSGAGSERIRGHSVRCIQD